jgi:DNA-binding protein Fis
MYYEEYMFLVKRRLNKNFNIIDDIEEKGIKINLCANSIFISENLIKNSISPFSKYEIYVKYYLKHYNNITAEDINEYFDFLLLIANENSTTFNHLQKCIIGVMVCDNVNETFKNYIKNLKHTKPFKLYFKGWSEVQLICVDLSMKNLFYNDAAKESIKMFSF